MGPAGNGGRGPLSPSPRVRARVPSSMSALSILCHAGTAARTKCSECGEDSEESECWTSNVPVHYVTDATLDSRQGDLRSCLVTLRTCAQA